MLPSGQKLILGLLATIIFEIVPFRPNAPFPDLLPFLEYIMEHMIPEDVQHHLLFFLDHFSSVEIAGNRAIRKSPSQTSRVDGKRQPYCFWYKNSMVKKEV
jgi:hypothetical protein